MRLSLWILATSTLAGLVRCSTELARHVSVYVFDRKHGKAQGEVQTVTPKAAESIFAQWLGLSQFRSLGELEESDVLQVNAFGQARHILSGSTNVRQRPTRLVVIVRGIEDGSGKLYHF